MYSKKILHGALAGIFALLPLSASAAVTYTFTADSSFDFPSAGDPTYSGQFTLTVAAPISVYTLVPLAGLASCSVTASDGSAAACLDQEFRFDLSAPNVTIGFGLATPRSAAGRIFYYFDPGAFDTNGLHESIIFGSSQHATLRVSGAAAAVPEPASWALMIGGFALAGAALRRRTATVRYA